MLDPDLDSGDRTDPNDMREQLWIALVDVAVTSDSWVAHDVRIGGGSKSSACESICGSFPGLCSFCGMPQPLVTFVVEVERDDCRTSANPPGRRSSTLDRLTSHAGATGDSFG
jgi:hypothetical protein